MAAQSALTEYIEGSNGVRFAYRRLGPKEGIPLAMHMHYRANMDFWDPLFLNTLAKARPVIIFDNSGVGRSSGEVAETYQGCADNMHACLEALGVQIADILGFSQGGMTAQMMALSRPKFVRKVILAATAASKPSASDIPGVVWPREQPPPGPFTLLSQAATLDDGRKALEISCFNNDDHGRTAFASYWGRLHERKVEPVMLDLLDKDTGTARQLTALRRFLTPDPRNSFDRLEELKMPVLIADGDNDILIPSSRSWELMTQIENAHLIIYPHSGHGFIWQYAETFAEYINTFLGSSAFDEAMGYP